MDIWKGIVWYMTDVGENTKWLNKIHFNIKNNIITLLCLYPKGKYLFHIMNNVKLWIVHPLRHPLHWYIVLFMLSMAGHQPSDVVEVPHEYRPIKNYTDSLTHICIITNLQNTLHVWLFYGNYTINYPYISLSQSGVANVCFSYVTQPWNPPRYCKYEIMVGIDLNETETFDTLPQ